MLRELKYLVSPIAMGVMSALLISYAPSIAKAEFPQRPINIICPWGTGGGSDQFTRKSGKILEEVLGIECPVSNIPGAGGTAGLAKMMAKPADGYTIYDMIPSSYIMTLKGRTPYTMNKDWVPLARMQMMGCFLFQHRNVPWGNDPVAMLKYIKDHPGEVNVAVESGESPGVFFSRQLAKDGYTIKPVGYKGPGKQYASVAGGHNELLYEQWGDVADWIESGKLKPLLYIGDKRSSLAPDIPCTGDIGLRGYVYSQWRSYTIRKGTPQDRIHTLVDALKKVSETEEWKTFLKNMWMSSDSYMGPEEFETFLKEVAKKYE